MTDQTAVQPSKPPRSPRKRKKDVLPHIPFDRNEPEFEEPGAFGEKVADKMLAIARKHFPPVSVEEREE